MGYVFLFFILFFLFFLGTAVYQIIRNYNDKKKYPPPSDGKFIYNNDKSKLFMYVSGTKPTENAPTVVLEAGAGMPSSTWGAVQNEISKHTRVCSYDRRGYGWSDGLRAKQRITCKTMAKDLHNLLEKSGEKGPYILVGHSFGGFIIRSFANEYLDIIHSLVLVDSVEENFIQGSSKYLKIQLLLLKVFNILGLTSILKSQALTKGFKKFISHEELQRTIALTSSYKALETTIFEQLFFLDSVNEIKRLNSNLGDKPLIVIEQGYINKSLTKDLKSKMQSAQGRLLKLSSDSELITAEQSGHAIQWMQPRVVSDAIESLLKRDS